MRQILLITILLLVGTASAQAQDMNMQSKYAASPELKEKTMALERRWAEAEIEGDTATMRRILADDMIVTTFDGTVAGKKAGIEGTLDPKLDLRSIEFEDTIIRRYGEVVVVIGQANIEMSYDGTDYSGPLRYTRVYHKRDGRWQVVAIQTTRGQTSEP